MAYQVCKEKIKTNTRNKLKEERDIADILKESKPKTYDIQPEWLEDISAQLDAYNSRKRRAIIWYYFIAMALLTGLVFAFIYTSKNPPTPPVTTVRSEKHQSIAQQSLPSTKAIETAKQSVIATSANTTLTPPPILSHSLKSNKHKPNIQQNQTSSYHPSNQFDFTIQLHDSIDKMADLKVDENEAGHQPITDSVTSLQSATALPLSMTDTTQYLADTTAIADSSQTMHPVDTTIHQPNDKQSENQPKSKQSKNWFLGLNAGPDVLNRTLNTNANLLNFKQKSTETTFINTWGFNFDFGYQFNQYLALTTGLGYKNYIENNDFKATTFNTYDTTYQYIDNSYFEFDSVFFQGVWYPDSTWITDIDTITTIDTHTHIDSSKFEANGQTQQQYLKIPIRARLTFISKKRLSLYTDLGLSLGVLIKSSGWTIGYDTDEISPYRTTQLFWEPSIGLGLNYNLIGPLDLNIYGAYQRQLSSMSLHPNISKHYNGFGLRTGLTFRF